MNNPEIYILRRYGLKENISNAANDLFANPRQIVNRKAKRAIQTNRHQIEHAAVHAALEHTGLAPKRLAGESERHYQDRKAVHVGELHKQVNDYIGSNPTDPLVRNYHNISSRLFKSAWAPDRDTGVNSQRTGNVDERLMHGYAPIVRYLATLKGHENAPHSFLDNPHLDPMIRASGDVAPAEETVDLKDEPDDPTPFETDFHLAHHPLSIEGLGGIRPDPKPSPKPKQIQQDQFRLPSGFVQLPPKPKRVIKNPALSGDKKNSVYQTIAHALANREDVHKTLAKSHGFDQPTATKHYNNFLKAKKKPQGKIRPENQTPLPRRGGTGQGGIRRKKFDRTDLMAIPIRYSLHGDFVPPKMRELINNRTKNRPKIPEGWGSVNTRTPGGYEGWEKDFPDQVEDRGEGDTHEITLDDEQPEKYAKSGNTGQTVSVQAKGEPYLATPNAQGYGIVPAGNSIDRISRSYQVYCDQNGSPISCSCPDHVYRHRVCKHMQAVAGIGKGGESSEGEDEPVKLSSYRAPAKGVIIRGTQYKGGEMLPDMESKFMNPRRKANKSIQ